MTDLTSDRIDAFSAAELFHAGAILVDVRSAAGRAKNGELAGAAIVAKPDVVNFVTQRLSGRRQPVLLFCGSVAGTEGLIRDLRAAGATQVADVEGGFAALVAAGLLQVPPPAA